MEGQLHEFLAFSEQLVPDTLPGLGCATPSSDPIMQPNILNLKQQPVPGRLLCIASR